MTLSEDKTIGTDQICDYHRSNRKANRKARGLITKGHKVAFGMIKHSVYVVVMVTQLFVNTHLTTHS